MLILFFNLRFFLIIFYFFTNIFYRFYYYLAIAMYSYRIANSWHFLIQLFDRVNSAFIHMKDSLHYLFHMSNKHMSNKLYNFGIHSAPFTFVCKIYFLDTVFLRISTFKASTFLKLIAFVVFSVIYFLVVSFEHKYIL